MGDLASGLQGLGQVPQCLCAAAPERVNETWAWGEGTDRIKQNILSDGGNPRLVESAWAQSSKYHV